MHLYILKSACLLALLYSGYVLLLSRETLHRFNRAVLLSILLASLLMPALSLTLHGTNPVDEVVQAVYPERTEPVTVIPEKIKGEEPHPQWPTVLDSVPIKRKPVDQPQEFPWQRVLWGVYLLGVLVMLVRLLRALVLMARDVCSGLHVRDASGATLVLHAGEFSPHSFLHWIVLSNTDYEQNGNTILIHEREHVRRLHSLDVLLVEAVNIVQWFNPAIYLLSRDLKAVHEYEADEAVLRQGTSADHYQRLLVAKVLGHRLELVANNFNSGSLRQRIVMMGRRRSSRARMWRVLVLLPVVGVFALACASSDIDLRHHRAYGHEYVDLGLPSGTLWATTNLGAEAPEDYGDHYAWGETDGYLDGKRHYDVDHYALSKGWSLRKYSDSHEMRVYFWDDLSHEGQEQVFPCAVDNKTQLDPGDDAAYAHWGGAWRTPSVEQWRELGDTAYCIWQKVEYRGYNVISKANGRSIFLPFTGGREGDLPPDGRVWNRVEHRGDGGYWTRTLSTMWSAYAYHLTSARPLPFHQEHVFEVFRSKGLSIRPVMMMNKKELKNKP